MNDICQDLLSEGVSDIFFGAGARNARLISVLCEFKQTFFLDERVASFAALGLSKVTKKPVVVCTTSGTAVAECYAAFIEAYYSDVKLIVISADRPRRLRGSYAPQSIDQLHIFSNYARTFYNGTVQNYSALEMKYPVHINFEIDQSLGTDHERSQTQEISKNDFTKKFNSSKTALAIFTESDRDYSKEIKVLDELNVLIYTECSSDLCGGNLTNRVLYERTILKKLESSQIDLVIKFGKTPFSKIWRELDEGYLEVDIISFENPRTGMGRGQVLASLPTNLQVKEGLVVVEPNHETYINKFPNSELSIFDQIYKQVLPNDIIFVGNSMAIRYLQILNRGENKIFASRGANGIDGQIATGLGIAKGTKQKVHCIFGDLTFLYDLGACLLPFPDNFTIHVVNNSGGRIFERVSAPEQMILEHSMEINKILEGFPGKKSVFEYIPCQKETREFWNEWSLLL